MKYHYSFNALKALESFLKTAYPNILLSIEDNTLYCGCIEIYYEFGKYEVSLFYGSIKVKLGSMTVEQIANLIYILNHNEESFIKK